MANDTDAQDNQGDLEKRVKWCLGKALT